MALPKVVSEHFTASVAADYECTREAPLNVPGFVDRNDIVYGTNFYVRNSLMLPRVSRKRR